MTDYIHFMIRTGRHPPDAGEDAISGRVERVGTGEKLDFGNAAELLRFIHDHAASRATIGRDLASRNAAEPPRSRD